MAKLGSAGGGKTQASGAQDTTSANDGKSDANGGRVCNLTSEQLQTNGANCGQCGLACAEGYSCNDGACGPVVSLHAGGFGGCAVLRDGGVSCWGRSSRADTGIVPKAGDPTCGTEACQPVPARVPGLSNAVQVARADGVTCALTGAGQVVCWGDSSARGLLGHDPSKDKDSCPAAAGDAGPDGSPCNGTPTAVEKLPKDGKVVELVAGTSHFCVRTEGPGGTDVYCWGQNDLGQLGLAPAEAAASFVPRRVAGFKKRVIGLAAGHCFHTCAALEDGSAACWGYNGRGQLGHAPDTAGDLAFGNPRFYFNPTPRTVEGLDGVARLVVGEYVSCALSKAGIVTCWGGNGTGGIGRDGDASTQYFPPAPVSAISRPVVHLAASYTALFATDDGGTVWVWGSNAYGTLGLGTLEGSGGKCEFSAPCITAPKPNRDLQGAVDIALGPYVGFARTADGRIVGWGLNSHAQLTHLPDTSGDLRCNTGSTTRPCSPQVVELAPIR